MSWFFAVLIVLAMGGVAAVAAGQGARLGPSYDDRPDVRLPADRPVTGEDLRGLRFTTAVRGYRASEVDELIERLAAQLDRDEPAPAEVPFARPESEPEDEPENEPAIEAGNGENDGPPDDEPGPRTDPASR